jgi:nucleotide-binding universal stress UspA family protein
MFNKILVAIDGSEPSLHALEIAVNLAMQNNAELTMLTVVPNLPPMARGDDMIQDTPDFEEKIFDSYKKMLNQKAREIQKSHPEVKLVPLVMKGRPSTMILNTASAREVDLIVVGNRGSSGIFSWVLGSVSRQVSEACTVPVLIAKDKKYCEK